MKRGSRLFNLWGTSQSTTITTSRSFPHSWLITGFVTRFNTTGATSEAGTANPSRAPEFTPDLLWGSCYLIFSFMCMFCWSLFSLLYFFIWPSCCLFFDLRILVTSLFGIFKFCFETIVCYDYFCKKLLEVNGALSALLNIWCNFLCK
jgi:hypothetical protein